MFNLPQNCSTSHLTICLTLEEHFWGIMRFNRKTIVALVIFPEKSCFPAKRQLGPNFVKIIKPYISWSVTEVILKHFSMIRNDRLKCWHWPVFPRNSLLTQLSNLGPILAKIMQTYANDSLYKILKCSMMGYSS